MVTTLVVAVIAALAPTLAITVNYLLSRKKLDTIHVLVNSRLSEALARISTLEEHLKANDVEIPEDDGRVLS